jgi:hypothetical protein
MTVPSRPTRSRKLLKISGQIFLTVLVTWFLLKAVGLRMEGVAALDPDLWRPDWGWLSLASLLLLVAYLYGATLWGVMVRELGGPRVPTLASCRVFFTANLGRYLPGKVWQLAGLAYLARREGVESSVGVAAALLGQALALAGATLVGLRILLQGGWGPQLGGGWVVGAVVVGIAGLLVPGVLDGTLRLWFRLAKGSMPTGWKAPKSFGVRWASLYAVGWIGQGTAFWILARSFGLELDLMWGVSAFAAAYLLGYVAVFAPAGLGVREGFLILFLTPVVGAGVAPLAIIARLWTTLVELLPAMVLSGGYVRKTGKGGSGSE